ncbi:larval cuticle protein 1-like [Argiope bruennichi]|uniref:Cuticle protein 6 like protein n=1 Tax=Argiope bruennichi TaxID=94029 RepID=A0A8T0FKT8_ARGBR|nr:larval cuticle protein 1-like [Argiope bruennichi]KAF8790838.1 Cuticle protein 6 like protein [Argiope bruennichi]
MRRHFLLLLALQICKLSAAHLGYGRKVPIPAGGRVQYQFIHRDSYQFGYDTGTGPSQSFREETRDSNGTVRGRYGYIDPLGTLRIVDYMADHTGFHILSSLQLTAETPSTTPRPTLKTTTTRSPRNPIQLPFLGAIPPFLPRQK